MTLCMKRKELKDGMEISAALLSDSARRYFLEKVQKDEKEAYFAAMYAWNRKAVLKISQVSDRYDTLELELHVAQPGMCIEEFMRDHMNCGKPAIKAGKFEDTVVFRCNVCDRELSIRKKLFELVE